MFLLCFNIQAPPAQLHQCKTGTACALSLIHIYVNGEKKATICILNLDFFFFAVFSEKKPEEEEQQLEEEDCEFRLLSDVDSLSEEVRLQKQEGNVGRVTARLVQMTLTFTGGGGWRGGRGRKRRQGSRRRGDGGSVCTTSGEEEEEEENVNKAGQISWCSTSRC